MIHTINGHEKEVYCIEFYLKFYIGASIATSFSSRVGTVSTDFTRISCGMEDITSQNHPSGSSKVVGLVE